MMPRINNRTNRIFGIDLLRVIAIFFVVHGHGAFLLQQSMLAPFANIPFSYEVDIFFILTGYLIGGALIASSEKHPLTIRENALLFYAKTALRILPCYFVMIVVNYLAVRFHVVQGNTEVTPLWRFFTMTQNVFTPFYDFFWESWCLPVQWWFYLLFPLLLILMTRKFSARTAVPIISLFFILLTIIYRISVSKYAQDDFWWGAWIRKTVASRFDNIFIGVLAAWFRHYHADKWERHPVVCLLIGLAVMVFVCLLPRHIGTVYTNVFALTVPPVAIALWLPFFSKIKSCDSLFGRIITGTSTLSYAMYLTNLLVCQLISAHFNENFLRMGVWGYLLYWIIVLAASFLLHIAVEKPFMRIRAGLNTGNRE